MGVPRAGGRAGGGAPAPASAVARGVEAALRGGGGAAGARAGLKELAARMAGAEERWKDDVEYGPCLYTGARKAGAAAGGILEALAGPGPAEGAPDPLPRMGALADLVEAENHGEESAGEAMRLIGEIGSHAGDAGTRALPDDGAPQFGREERARIYGAMMAEIAGPGEIPADGAAGADPRR